MIAVAAFLPVVLGLAAIWALDPASVNWLPPCPFHSISGLYCPGCGSGRALHLLLNGEFRSALSMNSLLVVGLPILAAAMLLQARRSRDRRRVRPVRVNPKVALLAPAIIFVFWVARNVPVYPLTLLAPH